eukprot:PhF_6_TR44470/c1_g1_i2/m.68462
MAYSTVVVVTHRTRKRGPGQQQKRNPPRFEQNAREKGIQCCKHAMQSIHHDSVRCCYWLSFACWLVGEAMVLYCHTMLSFRRTTRTHSPNSVGFTLVHRLVFCLVGMVLFAPYLQ